MLTLQKLKEHIFLEENIVVQQRKLDELNKKRPLNKVNKVKGSSSNFPYTERNFQVDFGYGESVSEMSPEEWQNKVKELEGNIKVQLDSFRKQKIEIEQFIASLNPEDAYIFNLFMSGMKQIDIGEKVGLDQPGISKRMNRVIKKWNDDRKLEYNSY